MRAWIVVVLLATGACSEPPIIAPPPPVPVPAAKLAIGPRSAGVVGERFELDASGSESFATPSTLEYRFDAAGDGRWTEFSIEAVLRTRIARAGAFEAIVEVRDVDGRVARARAALTLAENQPPVIELETAPIRGSWPLTVTVDLSQSSDPDAPGVPLIARVDFDGDGVFDAEGTSDQLLSHVYPSMGTFTLIAQIEDASGALAAESSRIVVGPKLDIDADANRDGLIDDADEDLEHPFTAQGGAVFVANLDDDDQNRARDHLDERSDDADKADLAQVIVAAIPDLAADEIVELTVSPSASIRMFAEEASGALSIIYPPGTMSIELAHARLAEPLVLRLEATALRSATWDGRVTITITRRPAVGDAFTDEVEMRLSPILFPSNLEAAERLYLMRVIGDFTENTSLYAVVQQNLPAGVELYDVDARRYQYDRWLQDNMQTGYQSMPGHHLQTYLNTERGRGEDLRDLVPRELTGADLGYVQPGGGESSLNYGGNIEVSAPNADWPFGRILVGGGSGGTIDGARYADRMTAPQRAFLDAQAQGPALELSSEWLMVGHLDEIFMLVPAPAASGPNKWKYVFASPELAVNSLQQLQSGGHGAATVFAGLRYPEYNRFGEITGWEDAQKSVDEMLTADLIAYNQRVQARIDTIRETLAREMNLSDDDFVEVPVLYHVEGFFGGTDLSAALNPGIQNLVVANTTLFVPDPEGPGVEGDVWQNMTRQVLEPLGLTVHFVDVWYSYHILTGEIHCGTEVQHVPFSSPWWSAEVR